MMTGLFDVDGAVVPLAAGASLLRGFALAYEDRLVAGLSQVVVAAPFRHMLTPGGFRMSVAMTNCGPLGWVSDVRGYRYDACDPDSGLPWPAMPVAFVDLATQAAACAGFADFAPDACLVNRYDAGARLTLHQDRNERDFDAPIVSVSLGLPALFLSAACDARNDRCACRFGMAMSWSGAERRVFATTVSPRSSPDTIRVSAIFEST
jgi:alkylated DNA repair protein (DNA oxidative demethylase)